MNRYLYIMNRYKSKIPIELIIKPHPLWLKIMQEEGLVDVSN